MCIEENFKFFFDMFFVGEVICGSLIFVDYVIVVKWVNFICNIFIIIVDMKINVWEVDVENCKFYFSICDIGKCKCVN